MPYTKEDFAFDEFWEYPDPEGKTQCFHCGEWFDTDDTPYYGMKLCEDCARNKLKDPELFLEYLLDDDGRNLVVFWFEYHYGIDWDQNAIDPRFVRDLASLYMMYADRDTEMGTHQMVDEIERFIEESCLFSEWWDWLSENDC